MDYINKAWVWLNRYPEAVCRTVEDEADRCNYRQCAEGNVENVMDRPVGDADVQAEKEKWYSYLHLVQR